MMTGIFCLIRTTSLKELLFNKNNACISIVFQVSSMQIGCCLRVAHAESINLYHFMKTGDQIML